MGISILEASKKEERKSYEIIFHHFKSKIYKSLFTRCGKKKEIRYEFIFHHFKADLCEYHYG